MLKKIQVLILLILTTQITTIFAQDNVIDEVVWVVGDDAILKSEIESQIQQLKYDKVDIPGDPYCYIAEQIAVRKLFINQAKLDSIQVSEGNVNMQVNQRVSSMVAQIGSEEKLVEYFGRPIRDIKEELRDQAREQMMIQQVQQKLVGDIKITPADVRKYFSAVNEEDIPTIPEKVELQILTIEPTVKQKDIDEIKEKLRGFQERVESGDASFSMLATLYSDDLGSAKQGGELGFMGRGQLVPEFADAAFKLTDPDKVSRVVETEFGYHIIQLIEKRGDKVNCRHILLKPKVSLDEIQLAESKLDTLANDIREKKFSFDDAALNFSYDKDTKMNDGNMVNPKDGTPKFEYQDLPGEISKVAYELKVGEISEPITMTNNSGKEVCAIIKLKEKTPKHKASVDEDFQFLRSIVLSKKNEEVINNWIVNKQKDTFIDIIPEYQNCAFQYPNWVKK